MAAAIGRHPKLAHVAQADHTEALPVLARKQHSLCLSLWELANKSQSSVPLQPLLFLCHLFPFRYSWVTQDRYGSLPIIKGQILPRSAPIKFRPHAIADRMTL